MVQDQLVTLLIKLTITPPTINHTHITNRNITDTLLTADTDSKSLEPMLPGVTQVSAFLFCIFISKCHVDHQQMAANYHPSMAHNSQEPNAFGQHRAANYGSSAESYPTAYPGTSSSLDSVIMMINDFK